MAETETHEAETVDPSRWFETLNAPDDEGGAPPADGGERNGTHEASDAPERAGGGEDGVIEDAADLAKIDEALANIPEELSDEYLDAKVKVKVKGRVKTVPLREVINNYSMRRAIQQAHEAWSGEKKRLQALENDALTLIQSAGNPATLARIAKRQGMTKEQVLAAWEDVAKLSPQEQARLEYEEEKRRLAAEDEQRRKADEERKREAETMQWVEEQKAELQSELRDAMGRGKVVDQKHWSEALDLMSVALEEGIEYTFEQALAVIEDQDGARYEKHLPHMPDDRVVELVGIERILKIAAAHTKPNSAARPKKAKPRAATPAKPRRRAPEPVHRGDIFDITAFLDDA